MYRVVKRKMLNDSVVLMEIYAPLIAKKAKAGQFVILRLDEQGERVPFTIAGYDGNAGTVTIIFQKLGRTTMLLSEISENGIISDLVGPLGCPSELHGYKKVAVISGGVGAAIAFPSAKELFLNHSEVDVIAGFRNREIVILEEELKKVCNHLHITTDDGSYGEKGFVTDKLKSLIESGSGYDLVIAIGPVPMMKAVSALTKQYDLKTLVSLNPIMIDGTGMCGCCRVSVNGKVKFACVDGPEFNGHEVDFDELMNRNSTYLNEEKHDKENCRLFTKSQEKSSGRNME